MSIIGLVIVLAMLYVAAQVYLNAHPSKPKRGRRRRR